MKSKFTLFAVICFVAAAIVLYVALDQSDSHTGRVTSHNSLRPERFGYPRMSEELPTSTKFLFFVSLGLVGTGAYCLWKSSRDPQ